MTSPQSTTPLIRTEKLSRTYGQGKVALRAVDNVNLEVHAGEVVLVFGPSGCGKSTLLSLLGGLDRDFEGQLELFGRAAHHLGDRELSELRGTRIGFVFQAFHLLGHLDVLGNVTATALFSPDGYAAAAAARRGHEVLERVGLGNHADSRPHELSGGQRQRVAIARALLLRPPLLLCDEPTGNLDRETGGQIIDLFAELHAELGTTFVIVTHEDRMTALPHRRISMLDGRFIDPETDG